MEQVCSRDLEHQKNERLQCRVLCVVFYEPRAYVQVANEAFMDYFNSRLPDLGTIQRNVDERESPNFSRHVV